MKGNGERARQLDFIGAVVNHSINRSISTAFCAQCTMWSEKLRQWEHLEYAHQNVKWGCLSHKDVQQQYHQLSIRCEFDCTSNWSLNLSKSQVPQLDWLLIFFLHQLHLELELIHAYLAKYSKQFENVTNFSAFLINTFIPSADLVERAWLQLPSTEHWALEYRAFFSASKLGS